MSFSTKNIQTERIKEILRLLKIIFISTIIWYQSQLISLAFFLFQLIFAVQHYIASPSMVSGTEKSIWNLDHPIQFTVCRLDQFVWNNDLGFSKHEGNWFRGRVKNTTIMSWRDIYDNYTNTETLNNLYISNLDTITTNRNYNRKMEEQGNITIAPIGVCKYYKGLPRNLLKTIIKIHHR